MDKNIKSKHKKNELMRKVNSRMHNKDHHDTSLDSSLESEETISIRLLHELQVHQIELKMQSTELIAARDAAEASALSYQALYDFAPVGYISLNSTGHITRSNLTAASMLGTSSEKAKGKRLAAYLTQDSLSKFNALILNTFSGLEYPPCEIKLSVDNKVSNLQIKVNINADGDECLTALTDITEHIKSEVKLKLAASVFSHAHEGIMITDMNGTILEVNDTFTNITGYSREEAIGQNPRILKSDHHSPDFYLTMFNALNKYGYWSSEIWNQRKNGEIYPEMLSISSVRDTNGKLMHYVAMFNDITDLKAHQDELEHTAHHDVLTGLPNRALLAEKLTQAIKQSQRRKKSLALAYLDLDGFKEINDTYGHSLGDQFLIAIAEKLEQALRTGDFLARIGGDEFIAVLSDLDHTSDCEHVLERMLSAASTNISCNDQILRVSSSIGVTFYPQNGISPDQLIRQADQAMYIAKDAGKNCYRFFDLGLAKAAQTWRESFEHITQAFERGEFVLYYQPKVNMKTDEVVGAEALIRWQHPQKGILPPSVFLPIIEGYAVSIKIGEWVIDTALQQIQVWQKQGLNIPVSVNISAKQLQSDDFVERLATMLADYPDVSPELLQLEILETSALEDIAKVSLLMTQCAKMGIKFALDDFGTGYSSLTYLSRLPCDLLKIDQSFVKGMLKDTSGLTIVKAVIGLADIFDRTVIAEGVEKKVLGKKLLSLNCPIAQGFGIARPMAADDFPAWVDCWQHNPLWIA